MSRSLSRPWLIAASAFLTLGFSRGIHSSFGVFYLALLETFGWSRGLTAAVYSVNVILDAALSPAVGHLCDRYGVKRILGAGCVLLAFGLWLSSGIRSLWEFYIYFGFVVALGFSFMGMVPHVVLISEWFASKRASALGTVYAGTGVGILILAPLIQWLISNYGWARALQILSVAVLVVIFPVILAVYQRGPHLGQPASHHRAQVGGGWTTGLALRSLQFWSLFFARVLAASGTTLIITHQVAHVVDIGFTPLYAATIFGLMGVTSTCGRVVFGFVADWLSKQAAYTANILTSLVGVAALLAAHSPAHAWLLYVYVIFFGIGFGSRAVIFSAISADIFSGKKFGSIYGYFNISVGLGGALGSWLGGFLHDVSGSYFVPFTISVILLAGSDVSVWLASMGWISSFDERLWAKEEKIGD
jgi:MFS family permease